jgi:hypothetical protein
MRTEDEVIILYNTYLKRAASQKDKYDAGYDPYFYALALGAACAIGFTLEKSMKQIERDVKHAEKKYK